MISTWWIITCAVVFVNICCSNAQRGINPSDNSIAVVTYCDTSIEEYTKYVFALNSEFCAQFGHSWILFDSSSVDLASVAVIGHQIDPRWEKVLIMKSIIQMTFETPSQKLLENNNIFVGSYLVWMDADMMIVNFKEDFLQYWINRFQNHDILISGEYHAETGVANTGCMIVKISSWSYEFFRKWWDQDHTRGHDQILFDIVYKQLMMENSSTYVHEHIQILPINTLNSIPPAYLTFGENDNVLHLMGESNAYRKKIFSFAEKAFQENFHKDMKLHMSHIGLTRYFLEKSMFDMIEESIPQHLQTLESNSDYLTGNYRSENNNDLEMLKMQEINLVFAELRERMLQHRQILSNIYTNGEPNAVIDFSTKQTQRLFWLETVKSSFDKLFQWYIRMPSFSVASIGVLNSAPRHRVSFWIEILNTLAMLGNDYLTEVWESHSILDLSENDLNAIFEQYQQTENYLRIMLEWVAPGPSKRSVYSMLSILFQNKASAYFTLANSNDKKQQENIHNRKNDAAYFCERALKTLEQALFIYNNELLPTLQKETASSPEEVKSYRYRLASLYGQIGEVRCACDHLASQVSLSGIQAYEKAAELWENLLSLIYYSHEAGSIPQSSYQLIWQENHHQYLQVVNNVLNYFRSSNLRSLSSIRSESDVYLKDIFKSFVEKRKRLHELFPREVPSSDKVNDNILFISSTTSEQSQKKKFRRKKKTLEEIHDVEYL